MKAFLDTNILIYLNSPNDRRHKIAVELIKTGGMISVQVLNEYCAISRRKGAQSWAEISRRCNDFVELLNVFDLTVESQTLARIYAERYGYTIYDANIIASAKLSGCETLWSEDMQHDQVIEGVRIANPFAHMP